MSPARIVHVLPRDVARGAQVFARALRERLDGHPDEHRTLSLLASGPGQLMPDVRLDVCTSRRWPLGVELATVVALRRALTAMRPAVVVAHGGEALRYVALAGCCGAKLVYKKTGISAGSFRNRGHVLAHAVLARRADVVVGVSDEVVEEARQLLRVPADRVVLAPNGRDPMGYAPKSRDASNGPPRLVFLGHLIASKRPWVFLDVVRRLQERDVATEAAIVGDGPLFGPLAAEAAPLGIEMLGRQEEVAELLSASDLLVFTGAGEGEGMPGVLIEAGLAGIPVVTTAVSGASTVVAHGVTGLIVPVDDLDALVDGVHRLALDPLLRAEMGAAARARCVGSFSLDASTERWQAVFDRLLGRAPLPSSTTAA